MDPHLETQHVNHVEGQSTSRIKVSVLEQSIHSIEFLVANCDHGVIEVWTEHFQHDFQHIEFAACNWVHPLRKESTVVLRRTQKAIDRNVQFKDLLINTLASLTNFVLSDFYEILSPRHNRTEGQGQMPLRACVRIHHAQRTFANMLRRFLVAHVPVLAIDEVTIRCNYSVLTDEVLAHRLVQIPVRYGGGVVPPVHMEANNCFKIKLYVPIDTDTTLTRLSSAMVEGSMDDVTLAFSSDLENDFTIAQLAPGQQIEANAKVCVGVAAEHTKFSPVARATLRQCDDQITQDAPQAFDLEFMLCGQLTTEHCVKAAVAVMAQSLHGLRYACRLIDLVGGH